MAVLDFFRRCLPRRVCCMPSFEIGLKALLCLIIILRVIALIMGCMYGPILYLVLPLGGLYLAADVLLLYTVFKGQGTGNTKANMQNGDLYHEQNQEDWTESNGYKEKEDLTAMDESCDFPTQRIWIITWLVMNIIGIIGLLAAIGALISIGTAQPGLGFFMNMTCAYDKFAGKCNHTPLHLILLFVVIILELLLIYSQFVVASLYIMLKDAWLIGVVGSAAFSDNAGLTSGGKRVEA